MKWIAQVGAALIAAAFVLMVTQTANYALLCLLVAGIVDLILEIKNQETISQWIHRLFPKKVDVGIVIGILVFSWWVFGPAGFLPVCLGVITGHLFWQEKQEK